MSVHETAEAVPVRVAAVARYLLTRPNCREERDELEAALSPPSIRSERRDVPMIRSVVNECVNAGLLTKSDPDDLALCEVTQRCFPNRRWNDDAFRERLVTLFFDPENGANHGLGIFVAWFLTQDPTTLRGDVDGILEALRSQIGDDRLGINDVNYGNLSYWLPYLGFGYCEPLPESKSRQTLTADQRGTRARTELLPDPTEYLERTLPALFSERRDHDVHLPALMQHLAMLCPVFPGGWLYERLASYRIPEPLEGHLHVPISVAWLRLHDRGVVRLSNLSDRGLVLRSGPETALYTHARWLAPRGGK